MKLIPLTQGKHAMVDDSDFESVSKHNWYAHKEKNCWYAWRNIGKKIQRLHQFLFPGVPRIDHKDGDGLNNQRWNLRPATQSQNMANQKKHSGSSSQFKGVSWDPRRGKWVARAGRASSYKFIGRFDDEIEAAKAYDVRAKEIFGEFARPNFPN